MRYKKETGLGHYLLAGMQNIRIEPIEGGGGHRLFIDGTEIDRVKSFRLEMGVDRITTLDLQMMVGRVDIEIEGQP